MYNFSDEAKERMINGKVTRAYLRFLETETEEEIIIDENNYLKDFEFSDERYVDKEGFIGQATAKSVTGNLHNLDENFNIQDREFELYIGVDLEDGTTEYQCYGTFIVQKIKHDKVKDNTNFEALDYMIKFNDVYIDDNVYPCTIRTIFENIVNRTGLRTKEDSFANENFTVYANPFEDGTTNREVLKAIAQMAFSWVRIDEENNVLIDFEPNMDLAENINSNQYYQFSKQNQYGEINTVVLKDSQIEGENVTLRDEESIAEYGQIEFSIIDNPFAYNQENRFKLIEEAKKLFGFKYIPIETPLIGYAYLNCKDKIKIVDLEGNEFETYILNHIIKYNGILLDEIKTPAMTISETKYQYTSAEYNALRQTQFFVDKANQQITGIITNQTKHENQLSQIQQNLDSIKANVDKVTNLVNEASGISILTLENAHVGDLISLHIYGNNTAFEFNPYPDEELYPDEQLFPYGSDRLYVRTNSLYPSNSNFPNDNLYPRKSDFKYYHLGITEVLRQFSIDIYDEYVLENNHAYVIRRVGEREDGSLYVLSAEIREDLGEIRIPLNEGINHLYTDYEVNMYATYATRTSLIDDFAKVVEQVSNISADEDSFEITVTKLIDEEEKTSKYTQTENKIIIEADEIELDGKINIVYGDVLYDNESGTTGTVTLSETAANFNYMEIYYLDVDNRISSTKISEPNNRDVRISIIQGSSQIFICTSALKINGINITQDQNNRYGSFSQIVSRNNMKIIKVVGFK